MRAVRAFLAVSAVAGCASGSMAETSRTFRVGAVIANGCAISADTGGNWGSIDLGSVNGVDGGAAQGSLVTAVAAGLQIDCTPGMSVTLTADNGTQPSNGVRQLVHATRPADRMPYQLFANGSQTPWTSQAIALAFPIGTSRLSVPVHARAVVQRGVAAGRYSDVVRITVTW
ncbi:Csu type fimbrial protein [Sphingomonas sp. STIS6.2]|uniref:Csu type fimbrial protein n=1 Tax=Sphingomonas sp. STIS6.2 TaxID=1379700 RepID=UPI0004DB6F87|nr:spore coat protein U domain-containing protein [Sphingomonas sp. STIS6.2]